MDPGVNCSFRVNPDEFVDAAAKARAMNYERVMKFSRAARSDSPGATLAPAEVPVRNFVDEEIFAALRKSGVRSARLSNDYEFVRRIYLDLTGRIPTPTQIREFVASQEPGKRAELIDRLLYSPEFADRWVLWFGDLVGNVSTNTFFSLRAEGRNAYYNWMLDSFAKTMSVKDLAWNSVVGKGNNFDVGPANYLLRSSTPGGPIQDTFDTAAYRAARDFLGMGHYDCVLCHNGRGHLDSLSLWGRNATRAEAQRMAAFFSRQRNVAVTNDRDDPRINSRMVTDVATGQYDLNTNYGNRPFRVPAGTTRSLTPEYRTGEAPKGADWRGEFAEFMINDPMFARNFANRIWKQLFNQGLVEPVDQLDPYRLDPANPPPAPWSLQASNPILLERLANELGAKDYSLREFIRLLVNSSAYQLSAEYDDPWKLEYQPLFARHYPRRLEGEEVHDAIQLATGVLSAYRVAGFADPINWALKLPDPLEAGGTTLMNTFYRGNRDNSARQQSGSIQQQLGLMNDTFVTNRIKLTASPVLRKIATNAVAKDLVEELYLTFLSRPPTSRESLKAIDLFSKATTTAAKNAVLEDLAWAMVNKLDFIFSY
ncbi:MAG: DUF1549 and DUF1553 domain-containing protein [Bryobacteraceae bacterium]|nr:DUF1549 and DUF1553 domain-containing protein [Bryobacteraceae bacterium]